MTDPIQTVREPTDNWHLLLADMKRAAEDPSVRFAIVDAWAARVDQLEAEVAKREAVVKAARELAVIEFDPHEGPPDPVVFWSRLTRLRAALDPTDTYPEAGETTLDTIDRHLSKRGTTP